MRLNMWAVVSEDEKLFIAVGLTREQARQEKRAIKKRDGVSTKIAKLSFEKFIR